MKRACKDCEWGVYYPEVAYEGTTWELYREHWYSLRKNSSRPTDTKAFEITPDSVWCHRFWPEYPAGNMDHLDPWWWCREFEKREP